MARVGLPGRPSHSALITGWRPPGTSTTSTVMPVRRRRSATQSQARRVSASCSCSALTLGMASSSSRSARSSSRAPRARFSASSSTASAYRAADLHRAGVALQVEDVHRREPLLAEPFGGPGEVVPLLDHGGVLHDPGAPPVALEADLEGQVEDE